MAAEGARWNCLVRVDKYDDDQVAFVAKKTGLLVPKAADLEKFVKPYETVMGPTPGNLATTAGLDLLTKRLITAGQLWDQTHTGLAVGTGTTAEAIGDTDLSGASKAYQACDASFPTQANGVLTFKVSFGTGDANFAWNEYGAIAANSATVISATTVTAKPANGVLVNHKANVSLGTKSSGTWAFTMTITIA